jgi:hypothetical protein
VDAASRLTGKDSVTALRLLSRFELDIRPSALLEFVGAMMETSARNERPGLGPPLFPFDAPVMTIDRVIMSGFSCRRALLDDSFTLGLHRFHEVGRGCSFE